MTNLWLKFTLAVLVSTTLTGIAAAQKQYFEATFSTPTSKPIVAALNTTAFNLAFTPDRTEIPAIAKITFKNIESIQIEGKKVTIRYQGGDTLSLNGALSGEIVVTATNTTTHLKVGELKALRTCVGECRPTIPPMPRIEEIPGPSEPIGNPVHFFPILSQ